MQYTQNNQNKKIKTPWYFTILMLIQGISIGIFLIALFMFLRVVTPIVSAQISYALKSDNQKSETTVINESFGRILLTAPPLFTDPVNTTNSIVIEKIDVNVPIVWDVSVAQESDYQDSLNFGVAHAAGTDHPTTENSNTYIFAHSTLNPLEIERYSATFTLLNKLVIGDRIDVFSNDKRYVYIVNGMEIVDGFNTSPLTRVPDYSMLTLQTCDPPGIPLNRLIITAELSGEYEI